MFANEDISTKDKPHGVDIKITDILEGGRKISGDWLEKEVEKRLKTEEEIQKGKKKIKQDEDQK